MKTLLIILSFFISCSLYAQAPEIEWQNTIGGIHLDYLYSIQQTADSGYILGGSSNSGISGDKTEELLEIYDYWLIKLDSLGDIQWQNTIQGDGADYLYKVIQTNDEGYILGGYSNSNISGDKTENSLGPEGDYWIVKVDSFGIIQWQHTIGGTNYDIFRSLDTTIDGGYILAGYSNSDISEDKSENAFTGGDNNYDYWVVKLDSSGNIEWDNTIGGTGDDYLNDIKYTLDGGYILGGHSASDISGDKAESTIGPEYTSDYWILKLDSLGNIEWQNTIGGDGYEYFYTIEKTMDGGYILGGDSDSNTGGDKSENNIGFTDYWIVKTDSLGNVEWENTLGGNSAEYLRALAETIDGNFLIGGSSSSNISEDKTEDKIGFHDYWIVKLHSSGLIMWDNTIGGNNQDNLYSIEQTFDEGYILAGDSRSPISGDKSEDIIGFDGYTDYWVVKLYPEDCVLDVFYADTDGDGYGSIFETTIDCEVPFGYVSDSTDCDDDNFGINPGADEVCNGFDDNCNFLNNEDLPLYTYYLDADEDGYGDVLNSVEKCFETAPDGFVNDSTDCDDTDELIHNLITYYADEDGDLYGDFLNTISICSFIYPFGYVSNGFDCDDEEYFINPGSNEILNGLDDNCNDTIDEGFNSIENVEILNFEIYPNPNNGNFVIKIKNLNSDQVTISVFNILGDLVYSQEFNNTNLFYVSLPESFAGVGSIIFKTDYGFVNSFVNVIR